MNAEDPGPEGEPPKQGGLGLMFLAAGVALAAILGVVGLIGYWALSR